MIDLLKLTIDAHGGLETWRKYEQVTARLKAGGVMWPAKQQAGVMDDIYVTANTKKQFVSMHPFVNPHWHSVYEPHRVAIETTDNKVVDELLNPRDSFAGYTSANPWTKLQLVYFTGYALWNYLNAPFIFAEPGYEVKEIDPWENNGEVFRRLQVRFPKEVATHCPVATFYIDKTGLIKRLDYNVEITNAPVAAHYLFNYTDVQGIKMPAVRHVYLRQEDNTYKPEPVIISMDFSEIKLT